MPKLIDHEKRKKLIVKVALKVFAENGIKDTNLSIIAKECGLSRTTVYQYFNNYKDIFLYAVQSTSSTLFQKYSSPEWVDFEHVADMIKRILTDCYDYAETYMAEIINFIKSPVSKDVDLSNMINRHTARIRLAIGRAIRYGIKTGQLKKQNSEDVVRTIMAAFGSYCFQRAYFPENAESIKKLSVQYIEDLRV